MKIILLVLKNKFSEFEKALKLQKKENDSLVVVV